MMGVRCFGCEVCREMTSWACCGMTADLVEDGWDRGCCNTGFEILFVDGMLLDVWNGEVSRLDERLLLMMVWLNLVCSLFAVCIHRRRLLLSEEYYFTFYKKRTALLTQQTRFKP